MLDRIRLSSTATLAGILVHYAAFYVFGVPLWTETLAEWIMARTPSHLAVPILEVLGQWAKPWAMTGALAMLGLAVFLAALWPRRWMNLAAGAAIAFAMGRYFEYSSLTGQAAFWLPAMSAIVFAGPARQTRTVMSRRRLLTSAVMTAGVAVVAVESWLRDRLLLARATEPVDLFPFQPPSGSIGRGLVRSAVTSTDGFYAMSKNAVDPSIDTATWRLAIRSDDGFHADYTYSQLMSMPRTNFYSTLRCVSNSLNSDLMGTALWTGLDLQQLIDRGAIGEGITEVAFVGVDGHGDSLPVELAFSKDVLLAVGMNGRTLNRLHGFPVRLIVPRYYGFKNVKWLGEIRFVRRPYFGTWPKMGYTKQPVVHTMSHIDRIRREGGRIDLGGVAFAGDRGIQRVQVRASSGWQDAELEAPLSRFCWTRWKASLPAGPAESLEARAQDGSGAWQSDRETPVFPDGVSGPTIRRIPS